jgi:DnaJ-class molecular chaperone
MVTAPKSPTERCHECEGIGTTIDSAMPCLNCRGKGVVSVK